MEKPWYKVWPPQWPKTLPLPYGKIPGHEYLRKNAEAFPDDIAIYFYGTAYTFRQVDENSEKVANFLRSRGIGKGDAVGIFCYNTPEHVFIHLGIMKVGALVCPINVLFKELELKYQINDSGMVALFLQDEFMPRINNIRIDIPRVKTCVVYNFSDSIPSKPTLTVPQNLVTPRNVPDGAFDLADILKSGDTAVVQVPIDVDRDPVLIEYTGGTTGMPKGALHSYYSHLHKPYISALDYGYERGATNCQTTPIYHIAGMNGMLACIYAGAKNVLLASTTAQAIMEAVHVCRCTSMYAVVPMYIQMMDDPAAARYDLASLKWCSATSFVTSLTGEIAARWKAFTNGAMLFEAAYGLTETHTKDTFTPKQAPKYGVGCCGIPAFDCDIKIVDMADRLKILPPGEVGEIAVKNPGCMLGYLNKPEATAATLVDGYVYTGDMGRMDEDGYLWFIGRSKEMIKVSGFSVFPEEVEALMNSHEAVSEVGVIPIPDEKKGEVCKAFVVLKPGYRGKISEKDLIAWARENMMPHKAPKEVEFRDALPKTGANKLLRRVLRDEESAKR